MMNGEFSKKKILITGGAKGIGLAIAEQFAREKATIAIMDVDATSMESLSNKLQRQHQVDVHTYQSDLADKAQIKEGFDTVFHDLESIDVLINNVGRNIFGDPIDLSDEKWDSCFDLNLSATWQCTKFVLPGMIKKQEGAIINIASVHAHRIVSGSFPYPVFKHGLMGLTRSLGIELAAKGIRVNSISPGLIDTPGTKSYFDTTQSPEAERNALVSKIPLGRIGTAEDIAHAAVFLSSDKANFVTASDLVIDGGTSQKYAG